MKKTVIITLISLILISLIPGVVFASVINKENVVNLVNHERTERNLNTLSVNPKLQMAAEAKAWDMIAFDYWEHFHEGKSPWDWMAEFNYEYTDAGENLAIDFFEVEEMHKAWMNSPSHRANIINSDYKEIGIGIAQGDFEGHETIIVVQMFGNPKISVAQESGQGGMSEKFTVNADENPNNQNTGMNGSGHQEKSSLKKESTFSSIKNFFVRIDNYMNRMIKKRYAWLYSNLIPNYFASANK